MIKYSTHRFFCGHFTIAMADKEQVKPLASAAAELRSDDHIFLPPPAKLHLHRNKYIKCCGCFAALLLILAVIGIVLGFTVLHIKTPDIKIDSLSFLNDTSSSNSGIIVVVASVSVRNPNVASFKYSKASTEIYYHDKVIGEGEMPPGEVKAKDTLKLNITVEIEPEKIDDASSLIKDWNLGALNISSYTEIPGRVKLLGSIKKNFVVKVSCSLTFNTKRQMIQEQECDQRVRISV